MTKQLSSKIVEIAHARRRFGCLPGPAVRSAAAQAKRSPFYKALGPAEWRLSNRLVARVRSEFAAGARPCDVWLDPE